ncbi:MAG TPA: lipoyl(octanoyl) transferase LipB [Candidatus Binatia bacterium]|jgi:lipoate-protein ligase B
MAPVSQPVDPSSDRLDDIAVQVWGVVEYQAALARQLELHARRVAGQIGDVLVLVAHPPTFTLGRHAPEADIVLNRAELERRGIVVARSDRGGRATYHGPGQVVLYPIVSIADLGLGVKDWVCLLEGAVLATLAGFGVTGHRRASTAGIWTAPEGGSKIASLGLRISRGTSYHGIAINTGLDASVFDCIVTCGVRGERVTTIAAETGRAVDDDAVASMLVRHVAASIRQVRERRPGIAPATRRTPTNERS